MQANHYFSLFGLDVGFDVNQEALKKQLLALQKTHHPDSVPSNATDTHLSDQHLSHQNPSHQSLGGTDLNKRVSSELINEAYRILSNDDLRAIYLLELAGHSVNLNHSIDDVSFLDLMMDTRIALENDDNPKIRQKLIDLQSNLADEFASAFDNKNWQHAQNLALKLKFLAKLQQDIKPSYHQLDSDDDLYV